MEKKSIWTGRIMYFIIWFGAIAVTLFWFGPHILNAYKNIKSINVVGGYMQSVLQLSKTDITKMEEKAEAYNEKIYQKQKLVPFSYTLESAPKSDPEYNKLLKASKASTIMGTLLIPSIDVNLPVVHGTKSEDLDYELGHMYGSSLIWGGESTHSVIAGHTGLKSADLFTHLTDMKVGDKFYIYVMDEIHEYTVDQINVVLPEDEADYMQIESGKDYCTLYTCTPYGINDHRLLVRGTRTGTTMQKGVQGSKQEVASLSRDAMLKLALWCIPTIGVFLFGLIQYIRNVRVLHIVRDEAAEETIGKGGSA